MEVVLKNPVSIHSITKMILFLYGTTNVIFLNGNVMDLRRENVKTI
jgi:hypothetical protein